MPPDHTAPTISQFQVIWDDQSARVIFAAGDPSTPVQLKLARGAPSAVTALALTGTGNSFDAPPSTITVVDVSGAASPYLDVGLTNGTMYAYRLRACDAAPTPNCIASAVISITPAVPELGFTFGPEETVFDHATQACEALDLPDLPTRAVRFHNEIFLLSANSHNFIMHGPDFDHLTKACTTPALSSGNNQDPSQFDAKEWLASLYVVGNTMHALVHQEFHDTTGAPCSSSPEPGNPCWYNAITAASSVDGFTFTQLPSPQHVVAAPALPWNRATMGATAYGQLGPSNMILYNGYVYAFFHSIQTPGEPNQNSGTCVMRTNGVSPSSWRAMDQNEQFTIAMPAPYDYPAGTPSAGPYAPTCKLLSGVQVNGQSVTYNTYLHKFIMVGASATWEGSNYSCGWFYSLSDDLIHWTAAKKLKGVDLPFGVNDGTHANCMGSWPTGGTFNLYVSLLDHQAAGANFESSGQTSHLYWTRIYNFRVPSSNIYDRDLLRQTVRFCWNNDPGCTP